mmetsp:Transcript_16376/g.34692  ORF Transcript_16376/g.34692 Transcript_16376/m.34692 type:complete len:119 (-) Transcript_16376:14-370(-)
MAAFKWSAVVVLQDFKSGCFFLRNELFHGELTTINESARGFSVFRRNFFGQQVLILLTKPYWRRAAALLSHSAATAVAPGHWRQLSGLAAASAQSLEPSASLLSSARTDSAIGTGPAR